jgi:hypothetical protein
MNSMTDCPDPLMLKLALTSFALPSGGREGKVNSDAYSGKIAA